MRVEFENGKVRFRNLIGSHLPANPKLPLVHTTDTYRFVDALSDGVLSASPCKVFNNEPLLYFFYGRPSYKQNNDALPTGLLHYFPVCLIIPPSNDITPKRVFPFDSGAFHNDLYSNVIHSKMKMEDFGLEPNLNSPAQLISAAFGTVENYLNGQALPSCNCDPSEFEMHSFHALVSSEQANDVDSRGSSVEIQLNSNIFIQGRVAAAILPASFVGGEVGTKMTEVGIESLPYNVVRNMKPNDFTSTIFDLCPNYYRKNGYV